MSDARVRIENSVMDDCTVSDPICLIAPSPKMSRKLFRDRSQVMVCDRSESLITVEPAALAGLVSSNPAVPVKLSRRPLAHHTRPANTVIVVPFTCGQTRTVAAAPVPGPPKAMVTASVGRYPVPGLVRLTATTAPPATTAVAAAPLPEPPENVTLGADE